MQQLVSIGFVLGYVVLLGVATFLQKPVMKYLDAVQVNFLMGIGILIVSLPILLYRHQALPGLSHIGKGLGIGVLLGLGSLLYFLGLRHLPVTVAATIGTGYVVVTAVLAVIFLHEPVTLIKVAGVLLTIAGVAMLASQSH